MVNLNIFIYVKFVEVIYKGELYIIGGYNGIHDVHFADMYKFNPGKPESRLKFWCWMILSLIANSVVVLLFRISGPIVTTLSMFAGNQSALWWKCVQQTLVYFYAPVESWL